jgi:hypothetical protein
VTRDFRQFARSCKRAGGSNPSLAGRFNQVIPTSSGVAEQWLRSRLAAYLDHPSGTSFACTGSNPLVSARINQVEPVSSVVAEQRFDPAWIANLDHSTCYNCVSPIVGSNPTLSARINQVKSVSSRSAVRSRLAPSALIPYQLNSSGIKSNS